MPYRGTHRIRIDGPSLRATAGDEGAFGSPTLTVAGIQVRVAGLDDIIASKEHAGRPKDHAALPELYRLRDRSTDDRPRSE